MNTPENLRYTETHEWISVEGENATVGITDHAQHELTDVVYVELPKIGRQVRAKDPVCVVESVKAASDIYSPVEGEIIAVNDALVQNPALVNTAPYTDGWLFKLKLANTNEVASLKDAAAYKAQIG